GRVEELFSAPGDPGVTADLMQQDEQHGQDLGHRVGLAQPARAENLHGASDVKQRANDHDERVTAKNQYRYTPIDFVHGRENDKHGAQQQLVSDGIEILAERGPLLKQTGKQAVQTVGDAGHHKDGERPSVMAAKYRDYGERHKNQAQQGQ